MLLEKEPEWGRHASGRNSGVVHAGFYYTPDSVKARFTREGNRQLTAYCEARGLPLNRCGKLVVARNAADLAGLDELLRRAHANGVRLEPLSASEARQLEPRAKTFERALFSPTTAAIDPIAVVHSLVADARRAGITLLSGTGYLGRAGRSGTAVRTSAGRITPGFLVNAAGLYADRIAHEWGLAQEWRILPFKGLFLQAERGAAGFHTHIYPVPDLRQPFLGVHITVATDGSATLGPTAIPAFWREHYAGWHRFNLAECVMIVAREASLLWRNSFGFRRLAWEELRKYRRGRIVALAAELAHGIRAAEFRRWGPVGIRAQLVNVKERRLEMDFQYAAEGRSFHVLNAVSPGFTCAFPFAAHLVDRILQQGA